jgi:hypothetical protein
MKTQRHLLIGVSTWAIGLAAVSTLMGCNDPSPPDNSDHSLEDCGASLEWVMDSGGAYTQTPELPMFKPLPHPTTECPFYRGAWQTFLRATQPIDSTGKPALATSAYPTIDDVFTPRVAHTGARSYLGDIKQAGLREILVDQNGNTLYYSIEVNPAYADFIHQNHLETSKAIQAYTSDDTQKNLFFPAGVAEFKAAWQVVEGDANAIADQTKDYVSMQTTVPAMHAVMDTKTGLQTIVEDRSQPHNVTVRLLALHAVFTLPGHPEFIWGSFEHTKGAPDAAAVDGQRDLAPIKTPDMTDTSKPISMKDGFYALYKGGTAQRDANNSIAEKDLHLNETSQKFLDPVTNQPQQTSIFRVFEGSKSNTGEPDQAITSLNHNVEAVFKMATDAHALPDYDKRGFYRLVGGQWMDKPEFFHNDFPIQNDASNPFAQEPGSDMDVAAGNHGVGLSKFTAAIKTDGSDSPYSILAGEDRMSSVAMESFTQPTGNFNNCFTCHNTQAINANGVPSVRQQGTSFKLLDPGLLNVSHVISQFVLEDCGNNVVTDASGGNAKAVCQ